MKRHVAFQPDILAALLLFVFFGCVKDNARLTPSITIKISGITATSVASIQSIKNLSGEALIDKGVCWSTNQNPLITDQKVSDESNSENFTTSITGLTPATTYYLRAYAINPSGTGYSSQMILTTLAASPEITTLPASNFTETQVTSGGNVASDGGAPVTARGVCWGINQNPTISDSRTTNGSGTGTFTSNITGLMANTTYYLRAYATNSSGTSYGSQISFGTPVFSDGSYITIKKATTGLGIDLVFMGDGYSIQDISSGKYESNIRQAVAYFFAVEPYKTYSTYFNVYMVYAISPESGISNTTTTVNTKFETKYVKAGSSQMDVNLATCRTYTQKAPIRNINNTVAVVIANSTQYGGTTYIHSGYQGLNTAVCPVHPLYFRGILQHEAGGHGFGNLADEYYESDTTIPQNEIDELKTDQSYGIFLNVDVTSNLSNILWKHFVGLSKYAYVGAYEGADLYSHGVWRPESGSLMINNIQYINAPGRELIVKRIMSLSGSVYSFSDFQAKDVMELTPTLRAASLNFDKSLLLAPPVKVNSAQ